MALVIKNSEESLKFSYFWAVYIMLKPDFSTIFEELENLSLLTEIEHKEVIGTRCKYR